MASKVFAIHSDGSPYQEIDLTLKVNDVPTGEGTLRTGIDRMMSVQREGYPFKLGPFEGRAYITNPPDITPNEEGYLSDVELDVRILLPAGKKITMLDFYELLGAEVTRAE